MLRELKCGSLHSQICRSKDADARIVPFGLNFVEFSPCVSKCVHIIFQSDIQCTSTPKTNKHVHNSDTLIWQAHYTRFKGGIPPPPP